MKKRIKLRAMTDDEFCRSQKCKTCPEFLHAKDNVFESRCDLFIEWCLTGQNGKRPYRDKKGKYVLVQADD